MPVTTIDYTAAGGASTVTTLDAGTYSVEQVAEGFHLPEYDYLTITYVASGNGAGEIETVSYKQGGASGATVAQLTLAYDASNRLQTVTRTV
jgi:hypothetical protein